MTEKNNKIKLFLTILFSWAFTIIIKLYIFMVENVGEQYLNVDLSNIIIELFLDCKTVICFILVLLISYLCILKGKKICYYLYKYRYIVAFGIFCLCVIFEITGSSIGVWCDLFGVEDTDIILGVSRPIRSDEWAVSTPMLFSQYENYSGRFPYFSETVRGTATDVFLEYGQPVYTIAMIFRPFYLGYLFLPLEKGMAFFWCGRMIVLFMVTFEFGMLLTKSNKKLSVVIAFLISFAPVVQWWFAINGLVEMLIYIQLSILMLWKYMNTKESLRRIPYVLVIVICAGGYILTMYPSWQISLAFVLLALGVWVILENYKNCRMCWKDWAIILIAVVVLVGILGYVFWQSWDTIELITNTVYPGSRFETGGDFFEGLFMYTSNIWMAMFNRSIGVNTCESAGFIDFFPVCYIIPLYVIFGEKKKDKLIYILMGISIFLGIYCVVGFPELLAKISFLSNVQSSRAVIAFGFCNIILLVRSLSMMEKSLNKGISATVAILVSICSNFITIQANPEYYDLKYFVFTVIIFGILYYGILRFGEIKVRNSWCIICIIVMLISGGLVNPVRSGVESVLNIEELQAVSEVVDNDSGALWIVEDMGLPMNNLGIMVGAPTINSTNVYPNLKLWETLDSTGKYEDVYNRYAHITIVVKEEGTVEFSIGETPDTFILEATLKDLRKLGVTYIISRNNLSDFSDSEFEIVKSINGFTIYNIFAE